MRFKSVAKTRSVIHAPDPTFFDLFTKKDKTIPEYCDGKYLGIVASRGDKITCKRCLKKLHSNPQYSNLLMGLGVDTSGIAWTK